MNNGQEKEDGTHLSDRWKETVNKCHQLPLGVGIQTIQRMVDGLNSKTLKTNLVFYIHQVVNGITPPNVAPYYHNGVEWSKPVKAERTGHEVQALLDKLPHSVRSGKDEIYEVYQIRLDNYQSYEHLMGTTTLLLFFLMCRDEADLCYFFADDKDSYTNWEILKNLYSKHFPQLEKGNKLS